MILSLSCLATLRIKIKVESANASPASSGGRRHWVKIKKTTVLSANYTELPKKNKIVPRLLYVVLVTANTEDHCISFFRFRFFWGWCDMISIDSPTVVGEKVAFLSFFFYSV